MFKHYFMTGLGYHMSEVAAYRYAWQYRPSVVRRAYESWVVVGLSVNRQQPGQFPFELTDKEREHLKIQLQGC